MSPLPSNDFSFCMVLKPRNGRVKQQTSHTTTLTEDGADERPVCRPSLTPKMSSFAPLPYSIVFQGHLFKHKQPNCLSSLML